MSGNVPGDNLNVGKPPDLKEHPTKGDAPAGGFTWPESIGVRPDIELKNQHTMSPKDVETFGQGSFNNGVMQFDQHYNLLDKFVAEDGCRVVRGDKAFNVMDQQDSMALKDLEKPIGSKVPANSDEQKAADEIAKLAPLNATGDDKSVIDGNERMREIFRQLPADAAQNVMDTANRALQKDGYRFVQSANGQIRLAVPTPDGPSPDIHIKEPECNLS